MRRTLLSISFAFLTALSFGQIASVQSGDWNDTDTWDCGCVPDFSDGVITIVASTTVSIPSGVTADVDELIVAGNGTLNVLNGGLLIIRDDPAGDDLTVTIGDGVFTQDGFLNVNTGGTLENRGQMVSSFINTNISGTYEHNVNGGIIPEVFWDTGSTLEVTGVVGVKPDGFGQSFYNVIWNSGSQNALISLQAELMTVLNDFTISSTGGSVLLLTTNISSTLEVGNDFSVLNNSSLAISATPSFTMNVHGDAIVSSSRSQYALILTVNGNPVTLNVDGDFIKTNGGGINFASQTGGMGAGTINVKGNFTATGGNLTRATGGTGNIVFNGTGVQTYTGGATFQQPINVTINANSIVDLGEFAIGTASGTGSFVCSGTVRLGSTNPAGALPGNIRMTSKTFNTGSTIVYNGLGPQFMAFSTTSAVNTVIDNSNDVTLVDNVTIGGQLTLTNGNLKVDIYTLTLGGTIAANGNSIEVVPTSSIVVNGSGVFGTFPFPAGNQTLANFTLNRPNQTVTFGVPVLITGLVTLANGTLAFPGQNLTLEGTIDATDGALSSNSASVLTVEGSGMFGTLAFADGNTLGTLTINRTSGSVSLNSTLTITTALNINVGDFTNTSGLTMDHDATLTRSSSGQFLGSDILTAPGEFYNVTYTTGTMSTGLELPSAENNLNDLTISGSGTKTLTQHITVNGDLNLLGSTLDANGFNITMAGTPGVWNRQSGSFVSGTGVVSISGNVSIVSSATPQFGNLSLQDGSTLTNPSGQLNISGNLLINANATLNNNSGTVVFNGSAGQTLGGGGETFHNIRVNKSGGNLQIQSTVNMTGRLTIQSATTVQTNNVLVLLSSSDGASGNASIGPLPDGASVSGNVSVRRYMSEEGRIYRYISSPVQNMTVAQLQASGIIISGDFDGADPCPGCLASMYHWNETLSGDITVGYEEFPTNANTESMEVGRGYATFVADNDIPGNVTINFSGAINSGPIQLPVTYTNTGDASSDGWNLVGNPYPSSISWDDGDWTKSNISIVVAVRNNGGTGGVFQYWDGDADPNGIPGGIIATGQAFWVRATGSNPELAVDETVKSSQTGVFFRKDLRDTPLNMLAISLTDGVDEDVAYYKVKKNANPELDDLDAPKLDNAIFDISTLTPGGISMAINSTDKPLCGETVPLQIRDVKNGSYSISARRVGLFEGYQVTLVDKYTNSNIDLSSGDDYEFTVTDETGTKAADRFSVILTEPAIDPGNLIAEAVDNSCNGDYYEVELTGAQTGVSYFAELDGKVLGDSVLATEGDPVILSVPAADLSIGTNQLNIKGFNYCNTVAMTDLVRVDHDMFYEVTSTDKGTCGESAVTLEASGAPANGSYNWYEEENSDTPIDGQHAATFTTPPLTKPLTYYVAAVNSLGCEGPRVAVKASVTDAIEPVVISGVETGEFESSYAEGNQWYLDGEIIEGATGQTFTPSESGTYTLEVNADGCVTTSSVDFLVTGIDELDPSRLLKIYSNPFVDILQIRVESAKRVENMSIFNSLGTKVGDMALTRDAMGTDAMLDMSGSAAGMYFVKTMLEGRLYTLKVIKE